MGQHENRETERQSQNNTTNTNGQTIDKKYIKVNPPARLKGHQALTREDYIPIGGNISCTHSPASCYVLMIFIPSIFSKRGHK